MIVIEDEDAARYRKSLQAVLKRLESSFYKSHDTVYRKWVNKHGEVLDELLEELKRK